MKIAQVIGPKIPFYPELPDTPFSIPTVSYLVTEELVKRGHDVTVFGPSDSITSAHVAPHTVSSSYMKKHRLMTARRGGTNEKYNLLAHKHFQNVVNLSPHFDIIHNHELGFLYFTQRAKAPVVTTLHYYVPDIKERELLGVGNNHYIAISHQQVKSFPFLPFAGAIHHGIDPRRFEFNDTPRDYVGWLGRVAPIKGCKEAIQAALRSHETIHLAGNIERDEAKTPYTRAVLKLIKQHDSVHYLGKVGHARKIAFLKNARAILMPIQWEEPFGLVAIEAFACGTPVIGFKRGSLPEIIQPGKTGYLVSTIPEMARAIKKINRINRADCRAAVEKYFNVDRMVDEHEKLYAKIIKHHS